MARMTDEEADYWDEYYTKNPPKVSGDGTSGFFVKHRGNIVIVDDDWTQEKIEHAAESALSV